MKFPALREAIRRAWSLLRRPFGRALAAVLLANLVFLALNLLVQGDPCAIRLRIRSAFASDDLRTRDFLWRDTRRGWFQFDDCCALQMLMNEDPSRLRRALAPVVYKENPDWEGQCRVLRFLAEDWVEPASLIPTAYSRYWHGYNLVGALALPHMELRTLRRLLAAGVWISIAALALAGRRSGPRVRRTALLIALAAATVWAVPYFGPGLSQAPGDAFLMFALAGIAILPRRAADPAKIVPYAALFGAGIAFLEMLTAKIPTSICWLAAMTLAAGRDEERPGEVPAPGTALAAVAAFCLGIVTTVAAKLLLAAVLTEPAAPADFAERLDHYLTTPDYGSYSARWVPESLSHLPGRALPFVRLFLESKMLTGRGRTGYLLVAATGLVLLAALVLGWRRRRTERGRDMLFLAGAAAIVPALWVLVLPLHAYIHAHFIVRMLVVPVSLGPLALVWPRGQSRSAPS